MADPRVVQSGVPGFDAPDDDAVRNVFFALKPDATVADSIVAAANAIVSMHDSAGRTLKRHRLHMTLLYIGNYTTWPAQTVRHAIDVGDAVSIESFELSLDIAGSFRNHDMPWWLGGSSLPSVLIELHAQLYSRLRVAGEDPRGGPTLTPHVTIARSNRQALPTAPIAPIHWRVGEFCLIESVMGEPNFRILKTWKLRERLDG